MRPTWASVDLGAIAHNAEVLAAAAPGAELCAVVKADGYRHGAVAVARTALRAGATWLAVALVEEGIELRDAGITAPVLVLSEPRPNQMSLVVEYDLTSTVYTGEGLASIAAAAKQAAARVAVHLKVDTGMRRVGAEPADAVRLADAIEAKDSLWLAGLWSHCPVADEPDNPFTDQQIGDFAAVVDEVRRAGHEPELVHLCNSAATLTHPEAHYDMVRCGIALYGIAPSPALAGHADLQPAMSLHSEVSFAKRVRTGTAVSYGHAWTAPTDTTIATIPIGYADGIPRRLSSLGGEVLVGGRRCPMVGRITMDQLLVDCGDFAVAAGEPVVFIGRQGDDEITATDMALLLDTIAYEVVCDIGSRVRRRYH
ncbi:MAG: alanine racemase [Acidimicrobiia bacterium]|nr:alanine racemase [Acidimicrobiia bacterium]